ncbi:cytochrome c oxidase accessory protein CcoG [Rhodovastum atsumiense]|uniref:Cytochrome c oxidase accessory protein CcoG n=1 Tax=Rhodovastum atsumiense TaxID=504468 RepID=A0A5M6J1P3_9PROT|nr:cytochrome c oxidase accessory protein CcoG [Rhodovastum atsumiense]KAA5614139.1 cytochrome c oxidase accessory protein CcoG [Rhodovastum atsumiense]
MSSVGKVRRKEIEDQLSDRNLYANRVRVYPKSVRGIARTIKTAILVTCLAVYYVLPWIRWDRGPGYPDQAVLLDLPNRRFHVFNLEFWPQDIYYLTGMLILAAISLFLVTSLLGRVWCGYACPQTVWTDLFMWVERRIEGDRNERMKRDQGPPSTDRLLRKLAKHAAWAAVAFATGGAWIAYFVDAPTLLREFFTGGASTEVYFFVGLFTFTTYLLAGWAREQVCTFMCPWPRFQSAMLDEQSLIVTYQAWRGEPRGHGRRDAAHAGLGACIDCNACVNSCPTGVDIRDGVQLECINCGLCIDACNEMMVKSGQPKWLVTWDTLARQREKAQGQHGRLRILRPRTLVYAGVLAVAMSVMGVALASRAHVHLSVQHDRAPLFVMTRDGGLRNAYTIRISNKTLQDAPFTLAVAGVKDAVMAFGEAPEQRSQVLDLTVPGDQVDTRRLLVFGRPERLADGSTPLELTLRNTQTGEMTTYRTVFMGPAR